MNVENDKRKGEPPRSKTTFWGGGGGDVFELRSKFDALTKRNELEVVERQCGEHIFFFFEIKASCKNVKNSPGNGGGAGRSSVHGNQRIEGLGDRGIEKGIGEAVREAP